MTDQGSSFDKLMRSLQERAKELNCLYAIEEALSVSDAVPDDVFPAILRAIPQGWRCPEYCQVRIMVDGDVYQTADYQESRWATAADISVQDRVAGSVEVSYTREVSAADDGPFLKEEIRLIRTIADRLGHFILYHRIRRAFGGDRISQLQTKGAEPGGEWRTVLNLLRQTDRNLLFRLSHQMLNHLCRSGVAEAERLLELTSEHSRAERDAAAKGESNQPHERRLAAFSVDMSAEVFRIAAAHMPGDELVQRLQRFIQEDKLSFLVQVVNRNLPLSEVADAVRRYHYMTEGEFDPTSPALKGITVSLIRRFLSDQLSYINIAKNYINLNDFYQLIGCIVYAAESHGKLGGKSAGMYLASQILRKSGETNAKLADIRIPKTWHISSDMLLHFMHYNNLDEVVEQKYKPIDQVRFEYPHIVQTFKNSRVPPEMANGLSVALDHFGDKPLIVRSSSLLEDQAGAAFSGKYKSLFLANQGSKQKRVEDLFDAIAEVYASTFGPDPIVYRHERELIDFGEEMGIIIQEVVGTRMGDYFLPAFAGVVFSRNEFRWSPRIKREDGLVRMVPGLGTRAVDRLGDDYPVLLAPGQPGLKANATTDDIIRYSPHYVDVINLKRQRFETVEVSALVRAVGYDWPAAHRIFSIHKDGHIRQPLGSHIDFDNDELVVTFDGLITSTDFVEQMQSMLTVLQENLNTPVDVEFAHDGKHLYLLQCRPQCHSEHDFAAPIPKNISRDRLLFSAQQYVSNGRVRNITHLVYVDPDRYSELQTRDQLLEVGRAVGRLNRVLPKRHFVLMGPGRWGSRGDIRLGVNVTYSDINNTGVLIEVARKRGNYVPNLSFGTHFFQDLVEAGIRYLPLYPDDGGVVFNESFFRLSPNVLADYAPEYAHLESVVRVIDIRAVSDGHVLMVLMNADLDQAVGVLADPAIDVGDAAALGEMAEERTGHPWEWRLHVAEQVAAKTDPGRFAVKAMYVLGSTANATARPTSDIDLLVHFTGSSAQRVRLEEWLDGWSQCLDAVNYLKTGHRTGGLLDVRIITNSDLKNQTGSSAGVRAIPESARPLAVGTAVKPS